MAIFVMIVLGCLAAVWVIDGKVVDKLVLTGVVIISALLLFVVIFGLTIGSIRLQGFIRQDQANVERQVMENTRSYRAGLNSNFERNWLAYETAITPEERQVICASMVRQFSADYSRLDERQQRNYDRLTCN